MLFTIFFLLLTISFIICPLDGGNFFFALQPFFFFIQTKWESITRWSTDNVEFIVFHIKRGLYEGLTPCIQSNVCNFSMTQKNCNTKRMDTELSASFWNHFKSSHLNVCTLFDNDITADIHSIAIQTIFGECERCLSLWKETLLEVSLIHPTKTLS